MDKSNEQQGIRDGAGTKVRGGCHCGAVRFEVELGAPAPASRCNCTICTMTSVTGLIVKPEAFTLVAGQEGLRAYAWAAKISERFFCGTCGIHCFGRGFLAEVGGDFVSVNLNCVDGFDPAAVETIYWDGRHDSWQAGPRSAPWPVEVARAAAA